MLNYKDSGPIYTSQTKDTHNCCIEIMTFYSSMLTATTVQALAICDGHGKASLPKSSLNQFS